jgi:hypothetical protein
MKDILKDVKARGDLPKAEFAGINEQPSHMSITVDGNTINTVFELDPKYVNSYIGATIHLAQFLNVKFGNLNAEFAATDKENRKIILSLPVTFNANDLTELQGILLKVLNSYLLQNS